MEKLEIFIGIEIFILFSKESMGKLEIMAKSCFNNLWSIYVDDCCFFYFLDYFGDVGRFLFVEFEKNKSI
jgi:hypothetical protein